MLERRRTPAAEQDLDEIWLHIAADSPAAADRVIDRIDQAEARLAIFPKLGRARDELLAGIRSWNVGDYLIFYVIQPDAIVTVRVLHGARDLGTALTS